MAKQQCTITDGGNFRVIIINSTCIVTVGWMQSTSNLIKMLLILYCIEEGHLLQKQSLEELLSSKSPITDVFETANMSSKL